MKQITTEVFGISGEIATPDAPQMRPAWQDREKAELESLLAGIPHALSVLSQTDDDPRFAPIFELREDCVTCGSGDFESGSFDLVLNTRLAQGSAAPADLKHSVAEFARLATTYVIVELPETCPSVPHGSHPSARQISQLLASAGLTIREKRFVRSETHDGAEIYLLLCEKG